MKQNNAAVTYDEINQIIGNSPMGSSGVLCASKESLLHYWNNMIDTTPLSKYTDKQLVRFQDIQPNSTTATAYVDIPLSSGTISGSNLIVPYTIYDTDYTFTVPTSIGTIEDSGLKLITSSMTSVSIPNLVYPLVDILEKGIFTLSYYVNSTGGENTAVDILSAYPSRKLSGFSANGINTWIGDAGHDLKPSFGTTFVTSGSYGIMKIGNQNWVKVTYVVNGTNLDIYKNNSLIASRTIARFTGYYGDNFYLANFSSYSGNTIKLKKVKIFDKALNASEVALL